MKRLPVLAAVLSLCAATSLRADTALVFNEIMYHPAIDEPSGEWIEFHNQLAVDLDVSGWSVTGGIDYTFPNGSVIRGRGFAVLAINPAVLMADTGLTGVYGPFAGRLANNGELLELRNNSQRVVDAVEYGVDGNWPVGPDGAGPSLAKRDRDTASGPAEDWTASKRIGGTPGAENFPAPSPEIAFDSTWRYEASGADLGTGWRAAAYDDSAWSSRHAVTNRAIPTLFNTGVGNNGVVLATGVPDPHYLLTANANGGVGTNALTMQNHPNWAANDSGSLWIGVVNSGTLNVNAGAYSFQTTFSLDEFLPDTVRIATLVAVDNDLTNIVLNGVPAGRSYTGFDTFSAPLPLTNGFVSGINTLEFRAFNAPPGANPGGFRAIFSSSGLAPNQNNPLPGGRVTYYFRKSFSLPIATDRTALRLNALVSDGAVFYLNGTEVHRINMPAGEINAATPALSDVPSPAYTGFITLSVAGLLQDDNVLAVELHQAAGGADTPLLALELFVPESAVALAFNEHAAANPSEFFVELTNYGTNDLDLAGFTIKHDGAQDHVFTFSAVTLPAGGFLVVSNAALGFIPALGDRLNLLTPAGDQVLDAIVVGERLRGRSPAGTGRWLYPNTPTPGAGNTFAFRTEVVINEIMYNPQLLPPTNNFPARPSPEEWIELHNRSGSAVDLSGWELDGGIDYIFSPGTSIPAGGYLVVADDVNYLRALYPLITIVGNYAGRLSGRSDLIRLRDAAGNPADEVRYFSGGRWPEYADGGGSSLELRNPNADNSRGEAWAASDETDKTTWQTYSYTMTAGIPAGSGQPTQWNDFILGLQSGGECLVDDITVVETNGAVQMIDNGDFENGATGWRVLGTHNRSAVIPEPGNPGNRVLHVVATGPQEHMHNHVERNYIGGRAVVNGRGYQITFRARWLAGNNLLNTRLYFNRVPRTTALPTAPLNGTPGAQNSRFQPNIGPTFSQFRHFPIVPPAGSPVTVSVVAEDPNAVASAELWWSVNSGAWSNAPMSTQGGGAYSGTIPGLPLASIVQFYVRAVDGLGAAATFPALGPASGALYKVEDGLANLPLAHNVRIILTPDNINLMHGVAQGNNQTNVMSNDLLPCTVIYDEQRAYYDIGVHLRGSQRGRYSDVRTGFHVTFQPDDPFLGVHPVMLVDRSGAGDAPVNRQEEIVLKHMMNRAGGLPGTYSQICRVLAPRLAHTGPAQWFPRHEDLFIETAFENGGDGTMFEMELIYFPLNTNAAGYKLPQPDNVIGTDMTDLGNDKEIYRYNFMLKNHRDTDDYSRFVAMCKALSLTGTALDTQTRQVMDVDQWMRSYALVSLCSVGDMYTFGNNHNFFMYQRPSDGKLLYFPWDMDFAFTGGANRALVGNQNLGTLVNLFPNLRCLHAHMLDIISVSFNTAYMTYWTDHYDNFTLGQSYAGSLNTIGARVTFVQGQIAPGANAAFAVSGANPVTTSNNLVTFTGTAPVTMKTIRVNGKEYAVTWTSLTAWRMAIPVSEPTNVLEFVGHDLRGNAFTNLTRTNIVNYTGPAPDPDGAIVFNEIMYNSQTPDTAFVELHNRSAFSFDLSDWRINGLSYVFPKGSIITNGQYLLLVNQVSAYAAAFGTSAAVPFDEFGGNLQNDGETLTLLRPGALPGEEIIVDKVKYDDDAPWPLAADGAGSSLQLIDAAEDNVRVSNWDDGVGWRYVTYTGTIQGNANPASRGTNFFMYLNAASDVYIDDMKLVLGSVPEAGANVLVNGDFEAPLAGTWTIQGNHSNTVRSTTISHSGNGSLQMVASAQGSVSGLGGHNLRQFIPGNTTNAVFTLSFWLLPNPNATTLTIRTAPGSAFNSTFSIQPILATPGAANTVARDLPAFPDLWLNEVQPENVSGVTDGQGEREPWIEIYNSGTTAISLAGCYLANNFSNLTQWAFPPGSSIGPGEFKVIFADNEPGDSTPTEWHANFRPDAGAGSISLAWTPAALAEVLDYFHYENIRPNWSYGAFPDGQFFDRHEFYRPTPGQPNDNTPPPITVFINEWVASNTRGLLNTNNNNRLDDWFELYNPTDFPADLTGYFLSDSLADRFQFPIPAGYVVPPHGFLLVWADNEPQLNNTNDAALHTNFRLERGGEQLALTAPDGAFIDSLSFEPQFSDISQGRFPDGSAIYFLRTTTPRAPNTSWTNRYPVIGPIADQTALVNELFTYNVLASDPDGHDLAYSLDPGAPLGAAIDPASGEFTWTPVAEGTNTVTVRVTDNSPLPLSTARTFRIIVTTGIRIGGITRVSATELAITLSAIPGKTYRAEYKDALTDADWIPIEPGTLATGSTVTIPIPLGPEPQRFFRVVQID